MSHYSDDPAICRVSFFKTSGKWYDDVQIKFLSWGRDTLIHDAFKEALKDSIGNHYIGMQAVCLDPYHELSHPISIIWQG